MSFEGFGARKNTPKTEKDVRKMAGLAAVGAASFLGAMAASQPAEAQQLNNRDDHANSSNQQNHKGGIHQESRGGTMRSTDAPPAVHLRPLRATGEAGALLTSAENAAGLNGGSRDAEGNWHPSDASIEAHGWRDGVGNLHTSDGYYDNYGHFYPND